MCELGLLVPRSFTGAVICEVCDEAHSAVVVVEDGVLRGFCQRSGELFLVRPDQGFFRVRGEAIAERLAAALQLEGDVRQLAGFTSLWRLGVRRLSETRVVFYLTPHLDQLDLATSMIDAVARQAAASHAALIVASDDLDHVRLVNARLKVVRLREVARLSEDGRMDVNLDQLLAAVLPDELAARAARSSASPQRDRVIPVLDQMAASEVKIETTNAGLIAIGKRVAEHDGGPPPRRSTIRDAVRWWHARRSS